MVIRKCVQTIARRRRAAEALVVGPRVRKRAVPQGPITAVFRDGVKSGPDEIARLVPDLEEARLFDSVSRVRINSLP
jgi:hypothetical protein